MTPATQRQFRPITALPRLSLIRELTYLAFVAMELCWIVPWYRALTPASAAIPLWTAFGLLALLMLVPIYAGRLMSYFGLTPRARRWILAILLLASLFAGLRGLLYREGLASPGELLSRPFRAFSDVSELIPEELVVFLIVLLVWWRGARLAVTILGPSRARFGFLFGFVVFIGFFLMITLATGETPGPLIPLFFFASLLALGLTRVDSLRRLRGARLPFGPGWLGFLVLGSLAIVGLGALLGAWLTRGLEPVLIGALALLVILPLLLVITPLVWLLYLLLRLIASGLAGLPLDFSAGLEALNQLLASLDFLARRLAERLPLGAIATQAPRIKLILTVALITAVFLLVLGAAALRLRRLRPATEQTEEHESVFSTDALLALLRELWAGAFGRLGETGALLNRFGVGRDLFAALSIRRMYLQALRLAASEGYPRAPADTPLEFLPTLGQAFPGREPDSELLTRAYVGVRYGELPDTAAGQDRVRAAFESIRDQALKQVRARKKLPSHHKANKNQVIL